MNSKQDVFRFKKSQWILLIMVGFIFLPMSIVFFIGFMDIRRIPDIVKIIFMGAGFFFFLLGIYYISYGFKKRNYFIAIDDEGIQEYGKPKCAWSEIKEMEVSESFDEPKLILKYKDPLTLKLKKIKIRPRTIYGFEVALGKIFNRLKDNTLIELPQDILEEIRKK